MGKTFNAIDLLANLYHQIIMLINEAGDLKLQLIEYLHGGLLYCNWEKRKKKQQDLACAWLVSLHWSAIIQSDLLNVNWVIMSKKLLHIFCTSKSRVQLSPEPKQHKPLIVHLLKNKTARSIKPKQFSVILLYTITVNIPTYHIYRQEQRHSVL